MSVFRFKQFVVDQSECAMKINTDGVLLGAMAMAHDPKRILDVGTGTGVISLMLAQRFPSAMVDAIEIDALAADTARRNFADSPFTDRLKSYAVSLDDFEPETRYDLIVSNPPFFLHSLQNDDRRKRLARHTDMVFFDQLLAQSKRWLNLTGSLQLIAPILLADMIVQKAVDDYRLAAQEAVSIRSFSSHSPIRRILSLGATSDSPECRAMEFIIYERHGVYSAAYRKLLGAFFLGF